MLRLIGIFALMFHCAFAAAELEIKAHYGQLMGKPDSFNKDGDSNLAGFPDVENVKVIGADAIYALPIIGLAVGLRYENLSSSSSGSTALGDAKVEVEGSRISLLGGYRLIELPIGYIGALAHFAISQDLSVKTTVGSTVAKYEGSVDSSYGVGVDAGVKLGMLMAGAEVGYVMLKAKDFKEPGGTYLENADTTKSTMDLTGPYFKVMIGLSL